MIRTSRVTAFVAAALLLGMLPSTALAADPIAVDDPGPGCGPTSNTGGSFPVPEDFHFVVPPLDPDHFWLFGTCRLTANDTDPDGDALTYEIVTQPAHGHLIADPDDPDGFFGYDPDPNFSTPPGDQPGGNSVSDSFTYRVSDGVGWSAPATMRYWVAPINDPPTFTPGGTVTVAEDSGSYSAPWATAVDPGPSEAGQTVHFELGPVTGVVNGVGPLFVDLPSIDSDGVLTFKVKPDTSGVAHVTFRAKDDGGLVDYREGSTGPAPDDASDQVTFDVVVTPDAVQAFDDTATTPQNVPVSIPVLDNDLGTGTITAATDGALGDVDIAADGLSVEFSPHVNAIGSDSFTYTFDDGAGSTDTATVQVTISDGTTFPVATNDSFAIAEDAAVTTFPVLDNDSAGEGGPPKITNASVGAKGTVAIADGGTGLTYRPHANAFGSDTFTYTITDDLAHSSTATVTMTISPSNDVPNAVNDAGLSVPESAGATALAVKANDTDPDGDALLITARTNGAHGTTAITDGGTGLTYDPNQLFFGSDAFTYTISDGHGGSDTATVLVTVVKDTVKPVVSAPSERFFGQTVGSTSTKARVSWTGTDAGGTGIAKYQLQVSVNGGSFTTVSLPSAVSTSIDRTLSSGASYRYRVRATDRQGNVGAYVTGPTFTTARYQNTSSSVTYRGSWTTKANASALGGSHRYASSLTARASMTRTARDFAWVATKTPTAGKAQVWIDGALAATVNLRSSATTYRKLVFQRHFDTLAPHAIEIRPIGGGRVYLDAFLTYR